MDKGCNAHGLSNRRLHPGLLEQLLLQRLKLHVGDRPGFKQFAPALQAGEHCAQELFTPPPPRTRAPLAEHVGTSENDSVLARARDRGPPGRLYRVYTVL